MGGSALAESGRSLGDAKENAPSLERGVRQEWEPKDLIEVWTLLEEDQERLRNKSGANPVGPPLTEGPLTGMGREVDRRARGRCPPIGTGGGLRPGHRP